MNIEKAKEIFDIEIDALVKTRDALDDTFFDILEMIISCEGKIIITGMGKPGHIATKLAATFSSLGTPSFFLHPGEAMHGDLGMISSKDLIIAISYSGESDEIVKILPNIKIIGAKIIGITGNSNSTLASVADIVQILPEFNEACYLGLAPTSSTTAVLCYGDALAVVASEMYGFRDVDFGKLHPAGLLGKKLLLKVSDLMSFGDENSFVVGNVPLKDAVIELSKKGLGSVAVVDSNNILKGIITDGDLRRQLEKSVDIYSLNVFDIMVTSPITITGDKMAVDAMNMMKQHNVSSLLVVENERLIGTIRMQDIIGVGIVI